MFRIHQRRTGAFTGGGGSPTIDGLHVDYNYTSNWTSCDQLYVIDDGATEQFSNTALTHVNGAPGNNFASITDGEYTSDSDYGGGASVDNIEDGNTGTIHWSDSNSSSLNIYVKWSTSFTLSKVQLWIDAVTTYGFPSAFIFKDRDGNTLTPTASPADIDDYIDISGTDRKYEWSF